MAKELKLAPNAKYPWDEMMRDYTEGHMVEGQLVYPSAADIGSKYQVPERQVQNRMSKYRWVDHRTAHQAQIANERRKEAAKKLAGKAVQFDEQSLTVAEAGMGIIRKRLAFIMEVQGSVYDQTTMDNLQAMVMAGDEINWRNITGPVYYKEMEALAKAAASFQDIGRKSLGIKDGENPMVQINVPAESQTSIRNELSRPDPDRVAGMLAIIKRPKAQLRIEPPTHNSADDDGDTEAPEQALDIVTAELVDEDDTD